MSVTLRARLTRHEKTMRGALWPPILGLFLLAVLLLWQVSALLSASRLVESSDAAITQAIEAQWLITDALTRQRGYLISGESVFLDRYEQARSQVPSALDALYRVVRDDDGDRAQVEALRAAFRAWEKNADAEVANYREWKRRAGETGATVEPFEVTTSRTRMDDLRERFARFVEKERTVRDARTDRVQRQAAQALGGIAVLVPLLGGLLALGTRRQMISLTDQYEESLDVEQEARERFAATLLGIGDAVLVTDGKGRVTLMNPVAESLTGWTTAEAQGVDSRIVFDIVNETTRQEVESPVVRVIREGTIVGLANHTVLRRRDGTEVPIDDSGAPIRDASGNLIGVVLVFRDVTERRQAELRLADVNRNLRRRAAEFEALFEASPVALFFAEDAACRSVRTNAAAQRMLSSVAVAAGIEEAAPGKVGSAGYRAFRGDEEIPTQDLPVQIAARTGRDVTEAEFDIVGGDGASLRLFGNAVPLFDEQGDVRGAVGAFVDITEKAALLEKQSRIAEELQRSLLLVPPPDAYPGITVKPHYAAAWDDALVGGDFTDVFAFAPNRVALVVGDITGKGLEAATYTAEVKFALRAFLREFRTPGAALEGLNRFILNAQEFDRASLHVKYLPLALAVVDTQTGEIVCSSAGMEPPFVLHVASGEAEELEAGGPLLGIADGVRFTEQRARLLDGDLLVMSTDGITEARSGGEFFGYEGLVGAVRENAPRESLADIAEEVVRQAREFAGNRQQDDICLLLVRRIG